MSNYVLLERDAYEKLCTLIRESHSVSEGIDDSSIATNSTYSSQKVQGLIDAIPIFDGDAETLEGHNSDYFAKTDDLASYLPKTGGVITSPNGYPIQLNRTGEDAETNVIDFQVNGVRQGMLGFSGVNNAILRDTDGNYYKLLHAGNMADHVLPLTGGTVKSSSYAPLNIECTSQNMSTIGCYGKDGFLGAIGIDGANMIYVDSNERTNNILHAGNIEDYISPFTGAASNVAGTEGLVPAPSSGNVNRMLRADGTWALPALYKVSTETIAQGSSITVQGSGIEIWTFVSGGPGIALIYVAKNTSSGLAYTKIADLTGGTSTDAVLNISITTNTPPHSVTIANNNTSDGVAITLTRYAFG